MPTDRNARRRFIWVLFALASALVLIVIWPFAGSFFAAAVLAAVFYPWHERLSSALGGRAHLSAALVTVIGLVAVVLPLGLLGVLVLREGQRALGWVSTTLEQKGIDGLVEPLPDALEGFAQSALHRVPPSVLGEFSARAGVVAAQEAGPDAEAPLSAAGVAAGAAGDFLSGLASFTVRLGVLVVATFFLLSEGQGLIDYVVGIVPLEERRTRELLTTFRGVAVGVFLSTIATAAAQTVAALVGYLIAGLPGIPLLLLVTFVLSFVPAVGGGGTVAAAGLVLCMSGRVGMGLFLVVWGLAVVGTIDNVVKPLVARDRAGLPTSVVFFAMICGLAVFGPMGLVAGPLILAFFRIAVGLLQEESRRARPADRAG